MGGPGVRPRRAVGRTARGCRAGRSCTAGAGVPRHPLAFLGIPRLLGRAGALTGPRRPSPGGGPRSAEVRTRSWSGPAPCRWASGPGPTRPGSPLAPGRPRPPAPARPRSCPGSRAARLRPRFGPTLARPGPRRSDSGVRRHERLRPGRGPGRCGPGSSLAPGGPGLGRASAPRSGPAPVVPRLPRGSAPASVGPRLPGPPWPRSGPGSPVGARLPRRLDSAPLRAQPPLRPRPRSVPPPSAPADVRGVC